MWNRLNRFEIDFCCVCVGIDFGSAYRESQSDSSGHLHKPSDGPVSPSLVSASRQHREPSLEATATCKHSTPEWFHDRAFIWQEVGISAWILDPMWFLDRWSCVNKSFPWILDLNHRFKITLGKRIC